MEQNSILHNSAVQTILSIFFGIITALPGVMLSGADDNARLEAYLTMFIPFALLLAAILSYILITHLKKRSVGKKLPLRLHLQTLLSILLGSVAAVLLGCAMAAALTTQQNLDIPGSTLMLIGIAGAGATGVIGLLWIGLQQRSKQALKKQLQQHYELP